MCEFVAIFTDGVHEWKLRLEAKDKFDATQKAKYSPLCASLKHDYGAWLNEIKTESEGK